MMIFSCEYIFSEWLKLLLDTLSVSRSVGKANIVNVIEITQALNNRCVFTFCDKNYLPTNTIYTGYT